MLFFRSEEQVERWCGERNLPKRPLVSMAQLWGLAHTWYSTRLQADSRRPGPAEMVKIFSDLGLTDPFWDPRADRFGQSAAETEGTSA